MAPWQVLSQKLTGLRVLAAAMPGQLLATGWPANCMRLMPVMMAMVTRRMQEYLALIDV